MAPLEVIGAGVSRTGTNSLQAALNILGYKTHHTREMLKRDLRPDLFIEAYKHPEKPVDWSELYGEYNAAVEFPTFSFIDRLVEYFPEAKIILTIRDTDEWYESIATIVDRFGVKLSSDKYEEYAVLTQELAQLAWFDGLYMDKDMLRKNPEIAKARYEAHNKHVMEIVPAERLLVLDLRDGISWESICSFLDKPIPSEPFPFLMTRKHFVDKDVAKVLMDRVKKSNTQKTK